jgi:hypothetical protein
MIVLVVKPPDGPISTKEKREKRDMGISSDPTKERIHNEM